MPRSGRDGNRGGIPTLIDLPPVLKDPAKAEDVAQICILELMLAKLKVPGTPASCLHRLAVRRSLDRLKATAAGAGGRGSGGGPPGRDWVLGLRPLFPSGYRKFEWPGGDTQR